MARARLAQLHSNADRIELPACRRIAVRPLSRADRDGQARLLAPAELRVTPTTFPHAQAAIDLARA